MIAQRFRETGFTLLELLVALAIFALLAVMAYGGLRKVLTTETVLSGQLDRLAEVQRTFTFLERDLLQGIPRPVRDAYGDTQAALLGREPLLAHGDPLLALTRTGYANPLGIKRSHLQRVAYRLVDGTLFREAWPVVDRAQDSRPRRLPLCTRVTRFRLRYLDASGQWHAQWPPSTTPGLGADALPRAVEATLELEDWGELTRLFLLGGMPL